MDRRGRSHPRRPVRAPLLDDARRRERQRRRALGSRSLSKPVAAYAGMLLWPQSRPACMWRACMHAGAERAEGRAARLASAWRHADDVPLLPLTRWDTPCRLYSRGKIVSFKRGKRTQTNHTVLVKIEGVRTADATNFYLGKRLAYVYRAPKAIDGSRIRVVWGKVTSEAGRAVRGVAGRGERRTGSLNDARVLACWAMGDAAAILRSPGRTATAASSGPSSSATSRRRPSARPSVSYVLAFCHGCCRRRERAGCPKKSVLTLLCLVSLALRRTPSQMLYPSRI